MLIIICTHWYTYNQHALKAPAGPFSDRPSPIVRLAVGELGCGNLIGPIRGQLSTKERYKTDLMRILLTLEALHPTPMLPCGPP